LTTCAAYANNSNTRVLILPKVLFISSYKPETPEHRYYTSCLWLLLKHYNVFHSGCKIKFKHPYNLHKSLYM